MNALPEQDGWSDIPLQRIATHQSSAHNSLAPIYGHASTPEAERPEFIAQPARRGSAAGFTWKKALGWAVLAGAMGGVGFGAYKFIQHRNAHANDGHNTISPITPGADPTNSGAFTQSFGTPTATANPTVSVTSTAKPTPTADAITALNKLGWVVTDGEANAGEFRCVFTKDAVQVTNDGLVFNIFPQKNGAFDYACGQITSQQTYLYGRITVALQFAGPPGVVGGFFFYGVTNEQQAKTEFVEIDMEFTGANTSLFTTNSWKDGKEDAQYINLPFDAASGVHEYAVDWRNDSMTWFVDNQQVRQIPQAMEPERHATNMKINFWNSLPNPWAGMYDVNQPMPPQRMLVRSITYTP